MRKIVRVFGIQKSRALVQLAPIQGLKKKSCILNRYFLFYKHDASYFISADRRFTKAPPYLCLATPFIRKFDEVFHYL